MAARLADAVARRRRRDDHPARRRPTRVFAILPPELRRATPRDWRFYVWDEATGEVRWMCSWDTTEDDVDRFAAAIARAAGN